MREIATYSDEQRHLAMLVWGFRANRNAAEVARLLSTEEYRDIGLDGVTRQTVANWARDGQWEAKINRELYREAPVHRFKTQAELILAAPEAARYLRETIYADASTMTKEEIMVMKIKSDNCAKLLDRVGFSPVGTRDVGQIDMPPEVEAEQDELSDEDWNDPYKVADFHQREMAKLGIGVRQMESKQRKAERT